MLKRPPQHRVDATAVYVDPDDTAWDNARIKQECTWMRKAGLSPSRHPVNVYHSGDSRYDLGACYQTVVEAPVEDEQAKIAMMPASAYLNAGASRFVLRRLTHP